MQMVTFVKLTIGLPVLPECSTRGQLRQDLTRSNGQWVNFGWHLDGGHTEEYGVGIGSCGQGLGKSSNRTPAKTVGILVRYTSNFR